MAMTWRARCSRGHYLASKDVHTTLGPEDWDDTCRCKTAPARSQPSAEDFGHRPIVSFIDGRALNRVCARCTTNTPTGVWGVRWPCMSAVVLGLVPRSRDAAPRSSPPC